MGIGRWQAGRRCNQSGNSGAEWVLLVALWLPRGFGRSQKVLTSSKLPCGPCCSGSQLPTPPPFADGLGEERKPRTLILNDKKT